MATFKEKYCDPDYIEYDDARPIAILKDKGNSCTYRLINNSARHLTAYNIDGGILKNSLPKCDKALYVSAENGKTNDILYLVEFKGKHINDATEQIESTIKQLIVAPKIKVDKLNARIVATGVPKILKKDFTSKVDELKKKYKCFLHSPKTLDFEETLK